MGSWIVGMVSAEHMYTVIGLLSIQLRFFSSGSLPSGMFKVVLIEFCVATDLTFPNCWAFIIFNYVYGWYRCSVFKAYGTCMFKAVKSTCIVLTFIVFFNINVCTTRTHTHTHKTSSYTHGCNSRKICWGSGSGCKHQIFQANYEKFGQWSSRSFLLKLH